MWRIAPLQPYSMSQATMPRKIRQLNIRFSAEERRRLKQAARLATMREHRQVTSAEIIREGTRRYVQEVLAENGKESMDGKESVA